MRVALYPPPPVRSTPMLLPVCPETAEEGGRAEDPCFATSPAGACCVTQSAGRMLKAAAERDAALEGGIGDDDVAGVPWPRPSVSTMISPTSSTPASRAIPE